MDDDALHLSATEWVPQARRFWPYLRPYRGPMLLDAAVIVGAVFAGAALIWMVGHGFDLLHRGRFDALAGYFAAATTLVVVLQSLRYASHYLHEWLEQRVIHAVRRDLYAHVLRLSTPFTGRHAAGDLLTRLAQDVSRVSQLLVLMPAHLFTYSLTFAVYTAALLYTHASLTVVVLLVLPLFWLHQRYFSRRTRVSARAFLHYQGEMGAFEEESLANVQGINSFNAEPEMVTRFDRLFTGFRRAAMRNLMLNNAFVVSFELLVALCAIVLVAIGVQAIGRGDLTIGGLVNFLLYVGYLAAPLQGLTKIPVESQVRAAAAVRVAQILDTVPAVRERAAAHPLARVAGRVRFVDLDFSYGPTMVLRGFNLDIAPGEFIGVVGPSGAGKSTLARLLLRFYDPSRGAVYVDGYDLRDLTLASLRAHVGVVWQEPFLLNDSVRANLLLAHPSAGESELVAAARHAQAHEFIAKLPHGYDTRIGADGTGLSTGQRQRLAIAQVLLKNPSLLIFDEATSALDAHAEMALQQALAFVRRGRTTIVIAHRYSTLRGADRIVYLNGDGSAHVGTHAELCERHTGYREAVEHQQRTTPV